MGGNLTEEKALGWHNYNTNKRDSLEDRVHLLLDDDDDQVFSHARQSFEDDVCEEQNHLHDPMEWSLYWKSQEVLLQEVVERYSSTGCELRQEVTRVIALAKEAAEFCYCLQRPNSDECTRCFRERVVKLLSQKGFNASLCTSKWKNTRKFPGGTHEYIEMIARTSGRKKQIPYVIEMEFRDQFKIARATNEYNKLIAQLPKYYIGKVDYLDAIVRIVCDAAKKSMKEKKIHMGPWRKRSFMRMKWSNSFERQSSSTITVDESLSKVSLSCVHLFAAPAVIVT